MQDGLPVAVEMLAHGNHPVVGKLRRRAGAAGFPGFDETMDRLRFGLLHAHAGEEGGHRRQPAQDQERRPIGSAPAQQVTSAPRGSISSSIPDGKPVSAANSG
jgi:hypothetical protein